MKKIAIGIDIGGTNTVFGFVDQKGNCLAEGKLSTAAYMDINRYLDDLHKEIKEVEKTISEKINIVGIGIGAPNGNSRTGTIEHAANLNWKGVFPIRDMLRKYFEVPIVIANDANSAAIGEMIYGGAKGMKDFVVITLGTGLGSGIVVNGKLVLGHTGFAGEVGHMIIATGGRQCGCGRKGCLETYVSATGVKRTVYKYLAEHIGESELRGIPFHELNAKMVCEAALRGDKVAQKTFRYTGKMLGEVLANVVVVTNPEAIFLFGGLTKAEDLLFKPTAKHMERNMLEVFKGKVKLLPSEIQGNAAILGSSALIWDELGL